MNRSTVRERSSPRRYLLARFARFFLPLALLCFGAVACQIAGNECGWFTMAACLTPSSPPACNQVLIGMGGGDTGAGGDIGAGGGYTGAGGDTSAGDTGATTAAATVGTGTGAGGSGDPGDPMPQPQDNPTTCLDGTELGTYVRCLGLSPTACSAQCAEIGVNCISMRSHPYSPSVGKGNLKQCESSSPGSTCTYCYGNGDVCSFVAFLGRTVLPLCSYTGGKGCE